MSTIVSTYVFMDMETSSLPEEDNNKSRITELSMVAVRRTHLLHTRPGMTPRVQNKLTMCFNPLRHIAVDATAVTELSNELLEFEKPFNKEVCDAINSFLNLLPKPVCLMRISIGSLVLVAALWGVTNPFIRKGTKGLSTVKSDTVIGQFYSEIVYLWSNWKYVGPWLVNQAGSLVYLAVLSGAELSLAVPVSNSLAFVFTAATGWAIGEETVTKRSLLGMFLVVAGTMLCYWDKSH